MIRPLSPFDKRPSFQQLLMQISDGLINVSTMNAIAIRVIFASVSLTDENGRSSSRTWIVQIFARGGRATVYLTRNVFKTQIFEQELERGKWKIQSSFAPHLLWMGGDGKLFWSGFKVLVLDIMVVISAAQKKVPNTKNFPILKIFPQKRFFF